MKITSQKFKTREESDYNSFPKFNINQIVEHEFKVTFDYTIFATSSIPILIFQRRRIKNSGGNFQNKGYLVGDSLTITKIDIIANTPTTVVVTANIVEIDGDTLVMSADIIPVDSEITYPFGDYTNLKIVNNTRQAPEFIDVYYNLIENNDSFNVNSLFDGEVNRFNAPLPTNNAQVINLTQIGNKSGGAFLSSTIEKDGTDYIFNFTYFNWLTYLSSENIERPPFFDGDNSVKSIIKLVGYAEKNNPNYPLIFESANLLGNVGWRNEAFNQNNAEYKIINKTIKNTIGDVISNINPLEKNIIDLTIEGINSSNFYELEAITLMPDVFTKNNEFKNSENTFRSNLFYTADEILNTKATKLGANIALNHISRSVQGNFILISFEIAPNNEYINIINELLDFEKIINISISLKNTVTNNTTVLSVFDAHEMKEPIRAGAIINTKAQGFLTHKQLPTDKEINLKYIGSTEDDFLFKSIINFEKDKKYDRLNFSIVTEKNNGEIVNILESINFNFGNDPIINKKLVFDKEILLNQRLDATGRNKATLKVLAEDTENTYEVELIISLIADWRYWEGLINLLPDFFDLSKTNNNLTKEWVNYLRKQGYKIFAKIELINDGVADFSKSQIELIDYQENLNDSNITTSIKLLNDIDEELTVITSDIDVKIRADHVLDDGEWDVNDTYGYIFVRPSELEKRSQISTIYNLTNLNNPFKPLINETKAKLTFPNSATARIECLIKSSELASGDFTLGSKIKAPLIPPCVGILDYLFQTIQINHPLRDDFSLETYDHSDESVFESRMRSFFGLTINGFFYGDLNICAKEYLEENSILGFFSSTVNGGASFPPSYESAICNNIYNLPLLSFNDFSIRIKTNNAGYSNENSFSFYLECSDNSDVVVDWGNGDFQTLNLTADTLTQITKDYLEIGEFSISVSSVSKNIKRFIFGTSEANNDALKCVKLLSFGDVGLITLENIFKECVNLAINNTVSGILTNVTNLDFAFFKTKLTSLYAFDFSNVTSAESSFEDTDLTSFPIINLPNCSNFLRTWKDCYLSSFPLINLGGNVSNVIFSEAWAVTSGQQGLRNNIVVFPAINFSKGIQFLSTWIRSGVKFFNGYNFNNATSMRLAFCQTELTNFNFINFPKCSIFVGTFSKLRADEFIFPDNIELGSDVVGAIDFEDMFINTKIKRFVSYIGGNGHNLKNSFKDTFILDFLDLTFNENATVILDNTFDRAGRDVSIFDTFKISKINLISSQAIFSDIISNSIKIKTADYDDILINFETSDNQGDNIVLNVRDTKYSSNGTTSRTNLITNKSWVINDNGLI